MVVSKCLPDLVATECPVGAYGDLVLALEPSLLALGGRDDLVEFFPGVGHQRETLALALLGQERIAAYDGRGARRGRVRVQ